METAMEFNPLSNDFFDDPYDMYKWLRDEVPCYHNERMGFWALSRFEDVVTAHRDWKTFTSTHGLTLDQLTDPDNAAAQAPMIITMDPPSHVRLRRPWGRAFSPGATRLMHDNARRLIVHYLDGGQGEREFDAVEDWAAPFPVEIISAILGVPEGDRQQIRHWTDALLTR